MLLKKTAGIFLILMSIGFCKSYAQERALIYGVVTDQHEKPLDLVNISILGEPGGTTTNTKGEYKLYIPTGKLHKIVVSSIGYKTFSVDLRLKESEKKELNIVLESEIAILPYFEIKDDYIGTGNIVKINPRIASKIPSISGEVESLIKTLPGVSSNNELSSQYNVRGGNFDENLVYVNDVRIYRPFLVRSGEQEGLSFINSDLVSSISFSAGGFEAKYGDKMSSVLDIKYKTPTEFAGSASMSLLGGAVHLEGATDNHRLKYLFGYRRKTNQYLLNSLETKGDYKPVFSDLQFYTGYDITENLELSFLGNYSSNKFKVTPETRQTNFGTLKQAYRLTIYFDGQEVDEFETMTGALSMKYQLNKKLGVKLIASAFRSYESETYDILGQYFLDELENDLGKDDFGEKGLNRGVGSYLNHARNYLVSNIYTLENKGTYNFGNGLSEWGLAYNREMISDELNEWKMLDSAGYSLPHKTDSIGYTDPSLQPKHSLELYEVFNANNTLNSNRYSAYWQHKYFWKTDNADITVSGGVRASYWSVNEQTTLNPRVSLIYSPKWKQDFNFRLSSGVYHQPPFYRELRAFDGSVNKSLKAQESIHLVLAGDYTFKAWNRPFKYTTEVYYKWLNNLVPYEIDNVRLRYYADNIAHGYATGIDMKINGEFVKDAESWASLSLMKTMEDIEGDFYYSYLDANGNKITTVTDKDLVADSVLVNPGYIPRPTDQRFNINIFFQDYLPKNPSYKMQMNFVYGTGLPFGPPTFERYKDTLRIKSYFRVDIGFSKLLIGESLKKKPTGFGKHIKSLWITAEVFNLLQNYNTISYIWVKDVEDRQWAVPNYLTTRRLNIKLVANF